VAARIPLPQLTARAAQGGEESATVFVVLDRFHFAIAIVTVVASTVFLLALMLMLVDERRGTVGILRLIGLRKSRILLQVFAEGLLIAAAGAAFGVLFAAALQGVVNGFFQWKYDTALVFVRITPRIALRCVLLAVPLGVLASVISSWSLLRSNVLDLAKR
jgi:putative ABC transport system permease protein